MIQQILNKKTIGRTMTVKEINRLADSLPAVEKLTHEKHYVRGQELINQGQTTIDNSENGEKLNPVMTYIQSMPVIIDMNHRRNMKKIHRKYGDIGIIAYYNNINEIYHEQQTSGKN